MPVPPDDIHIAPERADHPQVAALLAGLDAYLATLYAPEANHILDVDALLADDVVLLAARQGGPHGEVCGCGAVRRMPGEAATGGRPYGEVKRMMVAQTVRGRGIGAALLARLEGVLRAEGLLMALLETGRDQHAAVRLYERAGYLRRGPFAGYPDNGLSLFLEKRLTPPGADAEGGSRAARPR